MTGGAAASIAVGDHVAVDLADYLQRLKRKAGLSFRQITTAAGDLGARDGWVELPPATVSDFLRGKRLPTERQLRTFLRCVPGLPGRRRVAAGRPKNSPTTRPPNLGIHRRNRARGLSHRARTTNLRETRPVRAGSPRGDHSARHSGLTVLPPYLERDHDPSYAAGSPGPSQRRSAMVVLVGGSSTGKTRACWEAIHAEADGQKLLAGWRLWHPFDPHPTRSRPGRAGRVGPRTVVWLNETQLYLLTTGTWVPQLMGDLVHDRGGCCWSGG